MLGYLTALFVAPAFAQEELSQEIGQYARPAIVRVVAGCYGTYSYNGTDYPLIAGEVGAGYFVDPNGYIATNAHVIGAADRRGCQDNLFRQLAEKVTAEAEYDNISDSEKAEIQSRSRLVSDIKFVSQVILPTGDSFPFNVRTSGTPIGGDSQDVAIVKINVTNAPPLRLGDSSAVETQDPVVAIGYSVGKDFEEFASPFFLRNLPLGEPLGKAKDLAGRVATSQQAGSNIFVLQLDRSIPYGVSGGPVLSADGEVIGMLTVGDVDPKQRSRTSYVIPNSTVLQFVQASGGVNRESPTDRPYRDGLALMQQGDYEGAKAKFEEVKKLFPYHAEANNLIAEGESQLAEAKQNRILLGLLGTGAVSALILIGAIVFRLLTRKPTARPVAAARSAPPVAKAPSATPNPAAGASPPATPTRAIPDPSVTQVSGGRFNSPTVVGTQPFIELKNQDGQMRRFYLTKERHQLGRDRAWADLCTPDTGWEVMSRHHAVLEREGKDYRIYDGDRQTPSTNGLLIDGITVSVDEGVLLKDGDQLVTGHDPRNQVTLTYSHPGSNQTPVTSAQPNSSET